jgi:hypothetical protein
MCVFVNNVAKGRGNASLPLKKARASAFARVPPDGLRATDDIANLALSLCSGAAPCITGGVYF